MSTRSHVVTAVFVALIGLSIMSPLANAQTFNSNVADPFLNGQVNVTVATPIATTLNGVTTYTSVYTVNNFREESITVARGSRNETLDYNVDISFAYYLDPAETIFLGTGELISDNNDFNVTVFDRTSSTLGTYNFTINNASFEGTLSGVDVTTQLTPTNPSGTFTITQPSIALYTVNFPSFPSSLSATQAVGGVTKLYNNLTATVSPGPAVPEPSVIAMAFALVASTGFGAFRLRCK